MTAPFRCPQTLGCSYDGTTRTALNLSPQETRQLDGCMNQWLPRTGTEECGTVTPREERTTEVSLSAAGGNFQTVSPSLQTELVRLAELGSQR